MRVSNLILIFLCMSCSVKKTIHCNENKSFKNIFFKNIDIVEKHTLRQDSEGDFLQALDFLSQYVSVSYEKIYNYEVRYPNYEIFQEDKNKWMKWYEEKKCDSIQFKNNGNIGSVSN